MRQSIGLLVFGFTIWCLISCGGDGVFLFSIEDDIMLGQQVDEQIESDPSYVILDATQHQSAYAYLNAMKQEILASGALKHADDFPWELHIIDDKETLNAFATPGGYIYIYTGLINYLDDASSLAGVLGHEMAHADERHSSKQMQQQFGVSVLLELLTGSNESLLAEVGASLLNLSFSRSDEKESDESSVRYLCQTDFRADGAANFFVKLEEEGSANPPAFLSTHPDPENRVENIQALAGELNCETMQTEPVLNGLTYAQFKALLP